MKKPIIIKLLATSLCVSTLWGSIGYNGVEAKAATAQTVETIDGTITEEDYLNYYPEDLKVFLIKDNLYLTKTDGMTVTYEPIEKYIIADSGLNYRMSPNINADLIGAIGYGEEVTVVGDLDGWDIIEIDEQFYFCYDEYLSLDKPEPKKSVAKSVTYGSTNMEAGSYLGTYQLTAYEETGNCCADGSYPVVGVTVASNTIPLGTWIYIEGYGTYQVRDRGGMAGDVIDIYLGDPNTCIQFGRKYGVNVYLAQ